MKIKNLFLVCGSMILAGQLTADWTLVDDFQDGNVDDWLFDTVNLGEGNTLAAIPEPFTNGDQSNYVLEMDPGVSNNPGPSTSATTFRVRAARSMPEITETGTVYVRIAQPAGEGGIFSIINNIWGAAPETLDTIPNFNDFSALMRIEHTVHNFDVYDGTINPETSSAKGYQNVATELAMETWYEIWITIDHTNQAFAVYIRGGPEFPQQVKAYPAGENEMAGYRNKTFDPLATFMIIATTGTIGDARSVDNFYVDDIYVDTTGENLSSPTGDAGPPSDAEFDNISTRGNVGTGPDRLIGGFVVRPVDGSETGTVLVRAIGPGLGALGVAGTLVDPILTIFRQGVAEPVFTNDNWGDNANAGEIKTVSATIGAFALDDGSADSALLLSLEPGAYTAQITGKDGGTGIALVEVYAVD